MRTPPAVVLLCFAVACSGYLEAEDASPRAEPSSPPASAAPPAESDTPARGGLGSAVDHAVARARAHEPVETRCADGLVKVDDECRPCERDEQCPTASCNEATQRCAADGWCEQDAQCGPGQHCDAGLCLHADAAKHELCGLSDVHFAWDSARVSPSHRQRLLLAAPCLVGAGTLYIEAHADVLGTEEFNILLAERRGQAVRDLLVDAGVPREQLMVIAKGSLEADGDSTASRSRDRRVSFIVP